MQITASTRRKKCRRELGKNEFFDSLILIHCIALWHYSNSFCSVLFHRFLKLSKYFQISNRNNWINDLRWWKTFEITSTSFVVLSIAALILGSIPDFQVPEIAVAAHSMYVYLFRQRSSSRPRTGLCPCANNRRYNSTFKPCLIFISENKISDT